MTKLNELIAELCPNGVEYKTFFDVCDYIRGITYNKHDEVNDGAAGIKVLRANNITLETNTLNFEDVKTVSKNVKVKDNQWLKKNDILICAGSGSKEHIGKVAYIFNDIECTFGGFMGVIRPKVKNLLSRFLFHILTSDMFKTHLAKVSGAMSSTINNINNDTWKDFQIPVPPLAVQEEIVRILDKFTSLTAELTAELTARRAQYEYYRDALLTPPFTYGYKGEKGQTDLFVPNGTHHKERKSLDLSKSVCEYKKLGEIADISTGSSNTDDANENGIYPFYVRSQEPLRKNEYEYDEEAIITAGDGVGVGKVFHYVNGKYALHQRAYRIHPTINDLSVKYLYYYFISKFPKYIEKQMFQGSVPSIRRPMLNKFEVCIPTLPVQQRIVSVLDNFDAICADLKIGLPAEIDARKKQYEYYRDLLLNFKRK